MSSEDTANTDFSEADGAGGGSDESTPEELALFQLILDYGVTNNPDLVEQIRPLYAAAVEGLPESVRMEMLLRVIKLANERTLSVNALLPFLYVDPSISIISTAALHAAGFLTGDDDPLFGAKELFRQAAHLVSQGSETNGVGIVIGLLMLGDRRVTGVLGDCWRNFSSEGRREISHAHGPRVYAPFVDWLIDWLEDCESGEFGVVAAAVVRSAEAAKSDGVTELHRTLPIWSGPLDQAVKTIGDWSFQDYAEKIRPRLLQIAADESAPRVMNRVLKAWGIDYTRRIKAGIATRSVPSGPRRSLLQLLRNARMENGCLSELLPLEDADFTAIGGRLILSWAIFNPYCPTWNCLGVLPTDASDTEVIFHRSLTPFRQRSSAVAVVSGEGRSSGDLIGSVVRSLFEKRSLGKIAGESIDLIGHAAPDLVRVEWDESTFVQIVPDLFLRSPEMPELDVARSIEWIRENYGNPWKRAAVEREFVFRYTRPDGSLELPPAAPTTPDIIKEWFQLIIQDEHNVRELVNFPDAWHGAIDDVGEPMSETAYTFWQLDDFLARFGDPIFRSMAEANGGAH